MKVVDVICLRIQGEVGCDIETRPNRRSYRLKGDVKNKTVVIAEKSL